MSKFKTSIPVQVEELIGRLPKGSSINGVTLRKDNSAVDVEWEHDNLQTPYTFAVDCPDVENPPVIKPKAKAESGKRESGNAPTPPVSGQAPDSPSQETAPAAEAPRVKKTKRS